MNSESDARPMVSIAGRAPIEAMRRVPARKEAMRSLVSKRAAPRALPSKQN